MEKMEKDSKYSFIVNREVKEKFKRYCKTLNISPSDILSEIMINFNNDVDKVIQMKDASELQAMLQGKVAKVENEIELIRAKKEVANLAAEQRTC